ncbi:hypothetical protein D3C83_93980 [compost metagenome]
MADITGPDSSRSGAGHAGEPGVMGFVILPRNSSLFLLHVFPFQFPADYINRSSFIYIVNRRLRPEPP